MTMRGTGRKLREELAGHMGSVGEDAPLEAMGPSETSLVIANFDPGTRFARFKERFADPLGYLDEVGIERCYELASIGMDLTELAALLRVSNFVFNVWLDKGSGRRLLIEEAWKIAAGKFAYEGVHALKNALGVAFEVTRANHLATHYRWLASKLDPSRFGERVAAAGGASAQAGLILNVTLSDGTKQVMTMAVAPGAGASATAGSGDPQSAPPGAPPPLLPGVRLTAVD